MASTHRTSPCPWRRRGVGALALSLLLGAGCGGGPPSRPAPPQGLASGPTAAEPTTIRMLNDALAAAAVPTADPAADYQLAPEDLLEIILYNVPERDAGVTPRKTQVRVSQEGRITLPLLGEVPAAGLPPAGLGQALRARYARYLQQPQVGVRVLEYRGQRVTVLGAVRNPRVLELTGAQTLIGVLSLAGGLNERAGRQIYLYRQSPEGRQTYVVDLLALTRTPGLVNMPVQGGDTIQVPPAGMFFVDGAVGRPGAYPLERPYTLTQALAVAGGAIRTLAKLSEITIFRRRADGEADPLPVNLDEVQASRVPDPLIEADDVIVVPVSTGKYIVERFLGKIGLPGFPAF
jgi:polysaccharide biosynthesis/export protein